MEQLRRYALYPVIFGGSVLTLGSLLAAGVPYWRVGPPILVVVGLIVVALERWWPHARAWQGDQGDLRTDLAHFAVNVAASQASVLLFTVISGRSSVWPTHWSMPAQFLTGTLVLDLGLYVVHRASHVVPFLWRLHAVHHSPRRVYWLNGQRRHVLHELIEGAPGLLVLGLLGAPTVVVAFGMSTITLHLMFQHGNIDYRAGLLRYVFSVAELHRWHHQRRYEDVQGNYAAMFSFWDLLFGSALAKTGDAPLDVGMDDEPDLPTDYVGQLEWPFRRR